MHGPLQDHRGAAYYLSTKNMVKELNGLYRILKIIEEDGITLEEILQKSTLVSPASTGDGLWDWNAETRCVVEFDLE